MTRKVESPVQCYAIQLSCRTLLKYSLFVVTRAEIKETPHKIIRLNKIQQAAASESTMKLNQQLSDIVSNQNVTVSKRHTAAYSTYT